MALSPMAAQVVLAVLASALVERVVMAVLALFWATAGPAVLVVGRWERQRLARLRLAVPVALAVVAAQPQATVELVGTAALLMPLEAAPQSARPGVLAAPVASPLQALAVRVVQVAVPQRPVQQVLLQLAVLVVRVALAVPAPQAREAQAVSAAMRPRLQRTRRRPAVLAVKEAPTTPLRHHGQGLVEPAVPHRRPALEIHVRRAATAALVVAAQPMPMLVTAELAETRLSTETAAARPPAVMAAAVALMAEMAAARVALVVLALPMVAALLRMEPMEPAPRGAIPLYWGLMAA